MILPPAGKGQLVFVIEDADEGGYTAKSLGVSIFTEADTMIDGELREQIRDVVRCHFDEGEGPAVIRLHFVKEEVIAPFGSRPPKAVSTT